MQAFCGNSALFWGPEQARVTWPILIFSPRLALGTPENEGLRSNSALFWAPEKARVRWPLLILFPYLALGTPDNARVT